nr:PfkB family carbohydrate kinase [Sphingomonas sp. BIUV-7]
MKVARLPSSGESLRGESLLLEAGGKGLNVAIAARRLGADVDGIVAAGSDRFAGMAAEALAGADLPERMLVRFPGASGAGVGLIDAHGENVIAVYPGANELLSARDIEATEDRLAHSHAVLAQFEIGDAPIAAAFASARRRGVETVLNPSPFRPVAPAILAVTDILVVNATEAAALCAAQTEMGGIAGGHADDLAALAGALFGAGIKVVVMTLGADGAVLWHRDGTCLRQPAFATEAIDATGCGDAFLAGLVVGFARTRDWARALQVASACGAITCSKIGVIDALPTWAKAAELVDRLII